MSEKITENAIELLAIELLEGVGYEYIYAPSIAPDSDHPLRASFEDVVLHDRLRAALSAINPDIETAKIDEAIKKIERLPSTQLLNDNEAFHQLLTEGLKIEIQKDGVSRGEIVRLIDYERVSNNDFVVSNQFSITQNGTTKRPDIILFVNGLPLVVIELKNPTSVNATIQSAYNQIQTYKSTISNLFSYNAFCIISDGLEAKAGTISAALSRF